MLFSECGLKNGLLRSLDAMGYKEATPIQENVLNLAISGKNIVGQSQTGTGKTTAFLLPILNKLDTNKKTLQLLILAPTRELVVQIGEEIRNLTKFYSVGYVCLYGGASPYLQKKALHKKPAIIVATPGRLMDFMNQKIVNVGAAEYFILDEVDRMLDMGFVRDIRRVWVQMKNVKQTLTFSATMNNEMKSIIKEHVNDYEFIKIGEEVTVDKIHHRYMDIAHDQKLHNVIKLIQAHPQDKVLIFTHTKQNTKTIHKVLVSAKLNASLLNGDMAQGKRQSTLNLFKEGKTRILVTTDVASRGLNMDNVGLVINFDVPADAKSYIHRIGRTGRAGAAGKAIMLVSDLEYPLFKDIEKTHRIRIQESEHPVVEDRTGTYDKFRLNRSTDKQGGGRRQQLPKKRVSLAQKYDKDFPFDDQKPRKTENNYRSNPNHPKHERRPSRPNTRDNIVGGMPVKDKSPKRFGDRNKEGRKFGEPRPVKGAFGDKKVRTPNPNAGKFRGMGKPRYK